MASARAQAKAGSQSAFADRFRGRIAVVGKDGSHQKIASGSRPAQREPPVVIAASREPLAPHRPQKTQQHTDVTAFYQQKEEDINKGYDSEDYAAGLPNEVYYGNEVSSPYAENAVLLMEQQSLPGHMGFDYDDNNISPGQHTDDRFVTSSVSPSPKDDDEGIFQQEPDVVPNHHSHRQPPHQQAKQPVKAPQRRTGDLNDLFGDRDGDGGVGGKSGGRFIPAPQRKQTTAAPLGHLPSGASEKKYVSFAGMAGPEDTDASLSGPLNKYLISAPRPAIPPHAPVAAVEEVSPSLRQGLKNQAHREAVGADVNDSPLRPIVDPSASSGSLRVREQRGSSGNLDSQFSTAFDKKDFQKGKEHRTRADVAGRDQTQLQRLQAQQHKEGGRMYRDPVSDRYVAVEPARDRVHSGSADVVSSGTGMPSASVATLTGGSGGGMEQGLSQAGAGQGQGMGTGMGQQGLYGQGEPSLIRRAPPPVDVIPQAALSRHKSPSPFGYHDGGVPRSSSGLSGSSSRRSASAASHGAYSSRSGRTSQLSERRYRGPQYSAPPRQQRRFTVEKAASPQGGTSFRRQLVASPSAPNIPGRVASFDRDEDPGELVDVYGVVPSGPMSPMVKVMTPWGEPVQPLHNFHKAPKFPTQEYVHPGDEALMEQARLHRDYELNAMNELRAETAISDTSRLAYSTKPRESKTEYKPYTLRDYKRVAANPISRSGLGPNMSGPEYEKQQAKRKRMKEFEQMRRLRVTADSQMKPRKQWPPPLMRPKSEMQMHRPRPTPPGLERPLSSTGQSEKSPQPVRPSDFARADRDRVAKERADSAKQRVKAYAANVPKPKASRSQSAMLLGNGWKVAGTGTKKGAKQPEAGKSGGRRIGGVRTDRTDRGPRRLDSDSSAGSRRSLQSAPGTQSAAQLLDRHEANRRQAAQIRRELGM